MATRSRSNSVRWTALVVGACVLAVATWVLWRVDDLDGSSASPLARFARRDARVLLSVDGVLVAVLGTVVGSVAVALVAWDRDRSRGPNEPVVVDLPALPTPHPDDPDGRPGLVRTAVACGDVGLLHLAVALLAASFAVAATLESIVGEGPSVQRSVLTFGGAAVAMAALVGPLRTTETSEPAERRTRGSIRAGALLVAVLPLYGLVLAIGVRGGGSMSVDEAFERLGSRFPVGELSPGVQGYYSDLYGPAFGADEAVFAMAGELGAIVVLRRDGGFDRGDRARLERTATGSFGDGTIVVIDDGIAVVVAGFRIGLDPVDDALVQDLRDALAG